MCITIVLPTFSGRGYELHRPHGTFLVNEGTGSGVVARYAFVRILYRKQTARCTEMIQSFYATDNYFVGNQPFTHVQYHWQRACAFKLV